MQAIQTKYICPTNFRGSRVSARCQAGRITVEWDNRYDVDLNHRNAAEKLQRKLGWDKDGYGRMVSGCLPDGSYVFVFDRDGVDSETTNCAVCGVPACDHGYYSSTDPNTHRWVSK